MKGCEGGPVVSSLAANLDETEQVARVMSAAWGRGDDEQRVQSNSQKLRQEVDVATTDDRGLLKAVLDGRVVGFARIRRGTEGPSAWLFAGICVDPAHQRQGIGTALFEACRAHAQRLGASVISSEAHTSNLASIAFHEALGFGSTGEFVAADGDRKTGFSYTVVG